MNLRTREYEPKPNSVVGSRSGNECKIEFHRWGTDPVLLRFLQERAALVNARVFDLNPLQTADEIYHHMRWDSKYRRSITFATLNGRDIAFCIQEFIVIPLYDKNKMSVVWTHIRAVDPKHQVQGIGTALLKKGYKEYSDYYPDCFGGRSQAEPVFQSLYSSDLFGEVLALDRKFKGIEKQAVRYLAGQVMYPRPVDAETGLVIGAYPEGETGGYTLNLDHPGIQRISYRMKQLEVDKKRGDALIYLVIPKVRLRPDF